MGSDSEKDVGFAQGEYYQFHRPWVEQSRQGSFAQQGAIICENGCNSDKVYKIAAPTTIPGMSHGLQIGEGFVRGVGFAKGGNVRNPPNAAGTQTTKVMEWDDGDIANMFGPSRIPPRLEIHLKGAGEAIVKEIDDLLTRARPPPSMIQVDLRCKNS